jgi:hypothetical protein
MSQVPGPLPGMSGYPGMPVSGLPVSGLPTSVPPLGGPSAPPFGGDSGVPAPPQGPGVAPPFAAPPRDKDRKSLWIGLGVGGLVLVLCCVGGIFGFGSIMNTGNQLVANQAKSVVGAYLEALQEGDTDRAYAQLCDTLANRYGHDGFERQIATPRVTTYTIAKDVEITDEIIVTASVTRAGQDAETHRYEISQSGNALQICGGL